MKGEGETFRTVRPVTHSFRDAGRQEEKKTKLVEESSGQLQAQDQLSVDPVKAPSGLITVGTFNNEVIRGVGPISNGRMSRSVVSGI